MEEDKLAMVLENTERKNWKFNFAKSVNLDTTVGFETDLTTHSLLASKESEDCSLKFKINNEDKFIFAISKVNFQYV